MQRSDASKILVESAYLNMHLDNLRKLKSILMSLEVSNTNEPNNLLDSAAYDLRSASGLLEQYLNIRKAEFLETNFPNAGADL
jgi:hypothetical protein